MLASQALNVSESVGPWLQAQGDTQGSVDLRIGSWVRNLPLIGDLIPEWEVILGKLGEIAGGIGGFLVGGLAAATRGTVNFFFQLSIMLYANYFYLRSGPEALAKIMYLVPLESDQEDRLISRFVSVTRATLKGTLVIGIIQGGLAGLAFVVVGIEGAIFWGTIMAVLSIIPAVGAALVWGPAVIYLVATGQVMAGLGLLVWCGLVVGSSDNILRPILVGKDTEMPDLLVLLSTLGGLSVYGPLGVLIGPIIAALFLTVWELYSETFREILPEVKGVLAGEGEGS
jgi:predicted PurR-regulated permease PerM